jgi:putative tricarboxylic transport membrane protein
VEVLQHWLTGFAVATTPTNLAFAVIGSVLGTLIGLLPGLGPIEGTAILIPLTFNMDPVPAIIMLSAIYYGAMYGGTITSILVNVPGEGVSVVTCLDGYQMARQGRAGPALAVSAIGSFIGGTAATLALMVVALPLATVAIRIGPPEMFALLVFGFTLVTALGGRTLLASLLMTLLGLLLAMAGMDPVRGAPRFAFGIPQLFDGVGFVPVVMGLFGVAEILISLERPAAGSVRTDLSRLRSLLPSRQEWRRSAGAIGRGTVLGFGLGLIPGIGAVIPTFAAYALEKRLSKTPERFGTGVIEGVAAPETANNAYANASMVPLLTLGVPGSPTLAVLMGAFIIHGITPGAFLFKERPDLVWGLIASFYLGNLALLILNLPLVGLWAKLLDIRHQYLYPGILLFAVIGAYSMRQSVFDVGAMVVFGVLGYVFRKLDWPVAPTVLALILAPMAEKALRNSLEMSGGQLSILVTQPIALALLLLAALVLVATAVGAGPLRALRGAREE